MAQRDKITICDTMDDATKSEGLRMLTQEVRTFFLSLWAGLVSVLAVYFLIGSFWKAVLIGAFTSISVALGFATQWVLKASFALAVLAFAVALGLPPPDQWLQLLHEARDAVLALRTSG